MTGEMVNFPANGHSTAGYLARPKKASAPGIIVVQESWGLVEHITSIADRLAAENFVALAPDLYHGERAKSPDEAAKLLMALKIEDAGKDLRGAADHLLGLRFVEPKKIGVVGFCMGGQLALFAANKYPEQIGAAVDFYGIHAKVKLVPEKLEVPILAHFGNADKSVPVEVARALVQSIASAGKTIEAHFYDAGHAFFNDTRPDAYDKEAADLAWSRTLAFLRTNLT
jgi:carboxymethylenebutenolidase